MRSISFEMFPPSFPSSTIEGGANEWICTFHSSLPFFCQSIYLSIFNLSDLRLVICLYLSLPLSIYLCIYAYMHICIYIYPAQTKLIYRLGAICKENIGPVRSYWSSEGHDPHWTSVFLQIAPKRCFA